MYIYECIQKKKQQKTKKKTKKKPQGTNYANEKANVNKTVILI